MDTANLCPPRVFYKDTRRVPKLGVTNKKGKPFKSNSLHTLLTNRKYIGEWEINAKYKNRNQDKLLPYERYSVTKLKHGAVVDLELWQEVQSTIARIAGTKQKCTGIKGEFPLSGILQYEDGSPFHGTSCHGRTTRVLHYNNPTNKVRLSADAVHQEARQRVVDIISKSAPLKDAIRARAERGNAAVQLINQELKRVQDKLHNCSAERHKLNTRLDFLLSGSTPDAAIAFREEYLRGIGVIDREEAECKRQQAALEGKRIEVGESKIDWDHFDKVASRAQKLALENDPIALRNAYRILFEKVIVGQMDPLGVRSLQFVLRSDSSSVTGEEESSVSSIMAEKMPLLTTLYLRLPSSSMALILLSSATFHSTAIGFTSMKTTSKKASP